MIPDILLPLPINKIFGIGKKTVAKLNNIGLFNVKDIYNMPKEFYIEYMGKTGIDIYNRIRGIDTREVEVVRERKSIGRETTLKFNTDNKEELKKYLYEFSKEISNILKMKGVAGRTIVLKFKTASFVSHTRNKTILKYVDSYEDIYEIACEMLDEEKLEEELRLIGISITSFKEENKEQITFF